MMVFTLLAMNRASVSLKRRASHFNRRNSDKISPSKCFFCRIKRINFKMFAGLFHGSDKSTNTCRDPKMFLLWSKVSNPKLQRRLFGWEKVSIIRIIRPKTRANWWFLFTEKQLPIRILHRRMDMNKTRKYVCAIHQARVECKRYTYDDIWWYMMHICNSTTLYTYTCNSVYKSDLFNKHALKIISLPPTWKIFPPTSFSEKSITGGFNRFERISSKWVHLPQGSGVKINKYLSCHHLVIAWGSISIE